MADVILTRGSGQNGLPSTAVDGTLYFDTYNKKIILDNSNNVNDRITLYPNCPTLTSEANKVWKTDSNGVPSWQNDADTNTTYSVFGASGTNHASGLVPDPGATQGTTKFLREDGAWAAPPDTNTTYSVATNNNLGLIKIGYTPPNMLVLEYFPLLLNDSNLGYIIIPPKRYNTVANSIMYEVNEKYDNISTTSNKITLEPIKNSPYQNLTYKYWLKWYRFDSDYKSTITILLKYYNTPFNFSFSSGSLISDDLIIEIPYGTVYKDVNDDDDGLWYVLDLLEYTELSLLINFYYGTYHNNSNDSLIVRLYNFDSSYIRLKLRLLKSSTSNSNAWAGTIFLNFDIDTLT